MSLPAFNAISDECFEEFRSLIHEVMGITVRANRREMISGRLRRRMRELNIESFESYRDRVQTVADERGSFVNAVTTNETYFYRTPKVWNYINDKFLPEWHQAGKGKTLSIWSAASSTGEEAHTLGIVMQRFKELNRDFDYSILGTDIAPRVVDVANKGIYKGRAVKRFREATPELFSKYMVGDDDAGFSVTLEIKKKIRFEIFNLFDDGRRQPKHDLILLRNVLIYFSKEDQKRVMKKIHSRLKTNGIAIIGESETLNNLNTDFEPLEPTIYRALDLLPIGKAA
ncbi:MAG: protein-glutamate O-methyltransferase CheR [Granulosicoccus sp.]